MTQNSRDAVRTEVHNAVQSAVRGAQAAGQAAKAPTAEGPTTPSAPVALPPVPKDGLQCIVDDQGGRNVFTCTALPPQIMPLARMAQETAFGIVGLFAAIIILGPFARMFARRSEKRGEVSAAGVNPQLLQQQLLQLQQSVDAMSVEVERISESQRFQSKLLFEKKG